MNTETQFREDSTKDPETLEREINQTRAQMNQTLDSLERKLTAGQLLDQCLSFFDTKGTEIGSSLGRCIKENPMPFFLTATGIGWMMFGPTRRRTPDRYDHGSYGYGYADDGGAVHTREGKLSEVSEKLQSGAAAARQRFGQSAETAKETVNRTTDQVRETVGRTTEAVRDTMNRTAEIAQSQARQARDGFNTLLEEQPLILGAIGLAVGAIIGSALPPTEQEDRLIGEFADKAISKGKELGAQAYEKGSEIAKQKVERAVQQPESESFRQSPDGPGV